MTIQREGTEMTELYVILIGALVFVLYVFWSVFKAPRDRINDLEDEVGSLKSDLNKYSDRAVSFKIYFGTVRVYNHNKIADCDVSREIT